MFASVSVPTSETGCSAPGAPTPSLSTRWDSSACFFAAALGVSPATSGPHRAPLAPALPRRAPGTRASPKHPAAPPMTSGSVAPAPKWPLLDHYPYPGRCFSTSFPASRRPSAREAPPMFAVPPPQLSCLHSINWQNNGELLVKQQYIETKLYKPIPVRVRYFWKLIRNCPWIMSTVTICKLQQGHWMNAWTA